MIIAKAPLRISFLGGGSDYPAFFKESEGAVFGASINLYVYSMALPLPPFARESIRFTYRQTESVKQADDLEHPVLKAVLKKYVYENPINIATMADVAGNSGLGSSSSFTVATAHLINHIQNKESTSEYLANEAIQIERYILQESGGYQDQIFAAYGGLRKLSFNKDNFSVSSNLSDNQFALGLESNLMLIPFGGARKSEIFANKHANKMSSLKARKLVARNSELASEAYRQILEFRSWESALSNFSNAMVESWNIKVSTAEDEELHAPNHYIQNAIKAGATAGKICGAGSSGFILLICPPDLQAGLIQKMQIERYFQPKFDPQGSRIFDSDNLGESFENDSWNSKRWH